MASSAASAAGAGASGGYARAPGPVQPSPLRSPPRSALSASTSSQLGEHEALTRHAASPHHLGSSRDYHSYRAPPSPSPSPPRAPDHASSSAADPSHAKKSGTAPTLAPAAAAAAIASENRAANGSPALLDGIVCSGCGLGLEEASDAVVVSFGDCLWHVDCRCTKCRSHVEHDTNLLLLSDGSPVCENCSYICAVCKKTISNEAIVTGEESYHSDCFRCRSCHNRIDELVFAKTSQGIWCMACHNDRVAKSRKHQEAKRQRTLRKERESSATSARGDGRARSHRSERERDRLQSSSTAPPTPPLAGDTFEECTAEAPSADTPKLGSTPMSPLPSGASQRLTPARGEKPITPGVAVDNADAHAELSHASSGTNRRASMLLSSSPKLNVMLDDSTPRTRTTSSRATVAAQNPQQLSPTGESPPGAEAGSLGAPSRASKANNRRSGFYGAMSLAASAEDVSRQTHTLRQAGRHSPSLAPAELVEDSEDADDGPAASGESRDPTEDFTGELQDHTMSSMSTALPPSEDATGELHGSASFYDSDTLLFLHHVGGASPSHGLPQSATSSSFAVGDDNVEQLRSQHGASSDDERRDTGERRGKSEVARRVRESIRRSREGNLSSSSAGMSLDVELVEMLLAELDETKSQMKDLKAKYSSFKRASRSAFEGFSLARDEYDREVAARHEAEAQMEQLKVKMTEQALKLAAFDQEKRDAEELKRRSVELRSSVVGMEKRLSQLKAEMELSTAQVEELASVDEESEEADQVDEQMSGPSRKGRNIVRSLSTRLEAVKAEHRTDIEKLVAERDELAREIGELKLSKSSLDDETTVLEKRRSELLRENTLAAQKLDSLMESINKLQAASSGSRPAQHHYSPSVSSLASTSQRTPVNGSEIAVVQRVDKSPVAETPNSVVRKFKWGKGRVEPRPTQGSMSSSTGGKTSSSSRMAGSMEQSVRPHSFSPTSILRPVRCDYCGEKMWGLNEVRCNGCGCYAHTKCAGFLSGSCQAHTGPIPEEPASGPHSAAGGVSMFGNDLNSQAHLEERQVPVVVSKCIHAVELYGMTYEGIYRKTGGMGQTKLITQHFESGEDFDLEDVDKFNDLAATTSCLKNFFRNLPNPLFTHELHEDFVAAVELSDGEARVGALEKALYRLPEAHFYTARMLMGHLHRIHLQSSVNKMTPANLGVVFGPTLLRSADPSREFSDMGHKAKVVELMVEHHPQLFSRAYEPL